MTPEALFHECVRRRLATNVGPERVPESSTRSWDADRRPVVIPSLCESFGQVPVKALAFARPAIMESVDAVPEVIGGERAET